MKGFLNLFLVHFIMELIDSNVFTPTQSYIEYLELEFDHKIVIKNCYFKERTVYGFEIDEDIVLENCVFYSSLFIKSTMKNCKFDKQFFKTRCTIYEDQLEKRFAMNNVEIVGKNKAIKIDNSRSFNKSFVVILGDGLTRISSENDSAISVGSNSILFLRLNGNRFDVSAFRNQSAITVLDDVDYTYFSNITNIITCDLFADSTRTDKTFAFEKGKKTYRDKIRENEEKVLSRI